MGRELQKKKRRAMRQPARPKKPSKKVLNPRGNNVIAQNWYVTKPILYPLIFTGPEPWFQ